MRNEKKYNKSIYFTMVFVQTIIHLVVLSEIFLKLFLIDDLSRIEDMYRKFLKVFN